MAGQGGSDGKAPTAAAREARLAAALRENLKRRKAQLRERGADDTAQADRRRPGQADPETV